MKERMKKYRKWIQINSGQFLRKKKRLGNIEKEINKKKTSKIDKWIKIVNNF